jgi:hypothetical protein
MGAKLASAPGKAPEIPGRDFTEPFKAPSTPETSHIFHKKREIPNNTPR